MEGNPMSKECDIRITDKHYAVSGYLEEAPNSQRVTVKDQNHNPIGYYDIKKRTTYRTHPCEQEFGKGDCMSALLLVVSWLENDKVKFKEFFKE
jgi:hypothetical protein